jgi:hypothetical protein
MPLETVVLAFVIIAFVAIVWRFLPRSAEGAVGLPRIIDESVGMWMLRRALGRPTEPVEPVDEAIAEPALDEIVYRIGVPGAPPPTLPVRLVVSKAPSNAEPAPPATSQPVAPLGTVVADRPAGRRRRTRPSGALAAQRRFAGVVALAVVAIALTTLALGSRQLRGAVLSVTGTPGSSPDGGFVSGDSAAPSADAIDPGSSIPAPPTAEASATPAPPVTPAAPTVTPRPAVAPTPNPTRTTRPTARPTASPQASGAPTPSPSAGPSPTPPSPTPPPPSPTPDASPSPGDSPTPAS